MTATGALTPILLADPPRVALEPTSIISASLAHLLIALAAFSALTGGGLLAIGRLGTRLHRNHQQHRADTHSADTHDADTPDADTHDQDLRQRTLPWASICCYIGAGLLLLTSALLLACIHVVDQ